MLRSNSDEISGFLDQGTQIKGILEFSNTLRIDGDFRGTIRGEGSLIVGERARLLADIDVDSLELHGEIEGNVKIRQKAEIFATGRLVGGLETPVLVVQAGGVLQGKSQMGDPEKPASTESSTPPTQAPI